MIAKGDVDDMDGYRCQQSQLCRYRSINEGFMVRQLNRCAFCAKFMQAGPQLNLDSFNRPIWTFSVSQSHDLIDILLQEDTRLSTAIIPQSIHVWNRSPRHIEHRPKNRETEKDNR